MPKLDLRNALRIKAQGGEVLSLKGSGFAWLKPGTGPLDFAGMGQSNFLFWITNTSGRPAAHPDTFVWDPDTSAWVEPAGNGVRTFLNAMQAATGQVCRMVYGGQSGVPIALLQKGAANGNYEALLARIIASGADPQYMIWHQGEGDANTASPTISGYRTALDTFHDSITSDLSKTRAQLPIVLSSLANVDSAVATSFNQPDSSWQTIQQALAGINADYPNIHYSHSNRDAVLTDGVHWDGPSYGRSGARSAQTVLFLRGSQSARPVWYATAAERHSVTETDITVDHEMGTDFTPTSGITGFEVSDDNGANWEAATGARVDATTIRLTHSDMGAVERLVRYQYGKLPGVTGAVLDNSAIAAPLNFTSSNIVAAGAAALPTITYSVSAFSSGTGTIRTATGIAVPGSSGALLVLVGFGLSTGNNSITASAITVTAQPSNTPISGAVVAQQTGPLAAIMQAEVPAGTTSIDISLTLGATSTSGGRFHVSTIPVADMNSTTAVSSANNRALAALSVSTALATDAGGSVFAVSTSRLSTVGPGSFSGDETYSTRDSTVAAGGVHVVGDASNVSANASSNITATFAGAADLSIAAVSYR
jgi:hypothetical protein